MRKDGFVLATNITKDGEPHFGLKEHVAVDCAPCNKDIEKDLRFNCILDGLESL